MAFLLIFAGPLAAQNQSSKDWAPPIGIPEPEFGIREQSPPKPAAWPRAESQGSYYFDNSHPAATDDQNPYGYPDKPRLTIPGKIVLTAGSVTEIHGGPYLQTKKSPYLNFNADSTNPPRKDAPAFISGFNGAELGATDELFETGNPKIEVGRTAISYLIIENILFNRVGPSIIGDNVHHIAFRKCEVKGRKASCIGVSASEGGGIHDIVFYDLLLHDTLFWDSLKDLDYHGITISLYGRTPATKMYNLWVLDSTFHHCSGDSVQVNGNSAGYESLHHVYVGRNRSYNNRQSGFWCKQANHVVVSQNVVHDMVQHGAQPGNGMGSQYGPDNLWFLFNEIYNCAFGIRQTDTGSGVEDHNAYYIGNYIHDLNQLNETSHWGTPSGWGISFWHGGLQRHVVDNTITNVYGGIEIISKGPVYGSGNLIYNLKPNEFPNTFGQYLNHISCGGNGVNVDFVNGLVYGRIGGNSQRARIKWLGVQYDSLSAAQIATTKFARSLETNPLLDGVKLQEKSPAIGAGLMSDVYQTFQNLYGLDIRKGISGEARQIGTEWDIGAWGYPAVNASPTAPKNLRVTLSLK